MPGTELPTAQRLKRAWQRGDVPVSGRLTAVSGAIGALLCLPWAVPATLELFQRRVREALTQPSVASQAALALDSLTELVQLAVAPLAAGALLSTLVGLAQTRGLFAAKLIVPDSSRLWQSRLFELPRMASELGLRLAGAAVLLLFGTLLWLSYLPDIGNALWQPRAAADLALSLGWRLLWLAVVAGAVLATVDKVLLRGRWLERLRMTRRELLREWQEQHPGAELRAQFRAPELSLQVRLTRMESAAVVVYDQHTAVALSWSGARTKQPPRISSVVQGRARERALERARAANVTCHRLDLIPNAWLQARSDSFVPETDFPRVAELLQKTRSRAKVL